MGTAEIDCLPDLQIAAMLGKFTHIDNGKAHRVMGQAGKRFLANPWNPDKNVFPRLNIQIAIQSNDTNILTHRLVLEHGEGPE